ncbi:MAG: putative serine protease PepD [Chloroflexota bacterium]|nr:putative serine protease PepD [Chloroflexota bacterium]
MISAARPRDRLIAAVVLSAVIGLVGGGLAAWGIYARFGPVERVIQQTVVGTGNGGGLTAGAIAQAKSPSIVEVLTRPVTASSLLAGPTGIVNGFVVSANGLVLSSIHAIQGAAALRIATADGHSYPATIVRADPTHGVVLLQAVGAQSLTPLTFATVTPRVGDLAIAVAHAPFSPLTLNTGTISSVSISVTLSDGEPALHDALTVDATPDARQDGAPLLSGNGDVIGVVVDANGAAPGLVALSMSAASGLVAGATGSGGGAPAPNLGADSEVIDPATAAAAGLPVGALILSVTPGGPAAQAGLVAGDVVTAVGSTALDATHPFDPSVLGLAPDQQVSLTVSRDATTRTLELVVGSG